MLCGTCQAHVRIDFLDEEDLYGFRVEGRGAFPLSCLHDQRCHPQTVDDAQKIGQKDARQIGLVGLSLPDTLLWERFGWKVLFIRGPTFKKTTGKAG